MRLEKEFYKGSQENRNKLCGRHAVVIKTKSQKNLFPSKNTGQFVNKSRGFFLRPIGEREEVGLGNESKYNNLIFTKSHIYKAT